MSTNALNYDNQVRRLALGVEFEDALRNQELVYPVRAEIERESPHIPPSPKYFMRSNNWETKYLMAY